jgi:hypothetical protein
MHLIPISHILYNSHCFFHIFCSQSSLNRTLEISHPIIQSPISHVQTFTFHIKHISYSHPHVPIARFKSHISFSHIPLHSHLLFNSNFHMSRSNFTFHIIHISSTFNPCFSISRSLFFSFFSLSPSSTTPTGASRVLFSLSQPLLSQRCSTPKDFYISRVAEVACTD